MTNKIVSTKLKQKSQVNKDLGIFFREKINYACLFCSSGSEEAMAAYDCFIKLSSS